MIPVDIESQVSIWGISFSIDIGIDLGWCFDVPEKCVSPGWSIIAHGMAEVKSRGSSQQPPYSGVASIFGTRVLVIFFVFGIPLALHIGSMFNVSMYSQAWSLHCFVLFDSGVEFEIISHIIRHVIGAFPRSAHFVRVFIATRREHDIRGCEPQLRILVQILSRVFPRPILK